MDEGLDLWEAAKSVRVHHVVIFVHISHVSVIVLYYGQFYSFSMLITEIIL
jgi:hypothetical protein